MGTDTSNQVVATTALFGGNPTVFQLNSQTQAKGKTQSAQEWVDNSIISILMVKAIGTRATLTN
ncbi:hypothetical protein SDC49_25025 [Lactobacillus sp. R2/2]|nr:hypothetical protein [Lactobacillus sp. R2/2]